jgi:hypothetical protein
MTIWRMTMASSCVLLGAALACSRDRETEAPDEQMVPASGPAAERKAPPGAGSSAPEEQVEKAEPKAQPPRGQNPWGATGYGPPLQKSAPAPDPDPDPEPDGGERR